MSLLLFCTCVIIVLFCFLANEIQGHQSISILSKWLDKGKRSPCIRQRRDIGSADRSSQQLLQASTACLVWLFACAEAVTSHSTVFNKPSTLPREPLCLSSVQPLELLPTIKHAPLQTCHSLDTCRQVCKEEEEKKLDCN